LSFALTIGRWLCNQGGHFIKAIRQTIFAYFDDNSFTG
jgi:hypothetical protein